MSRKVIDEIRLLSAEQVENAKSGHPGLPLGAAPMAYALYARLMKYSPNNPTWIDRDRFVLSAGHGSALLYSMLHLFGNLSMDELKQFRKLGSKTPGHPEMDVTPGVDMSTGPLGQGISNAVGFAIAEAKLAEKFNTEKYKVFDHYTYVLHGDGCLMEGISYEAASLAGHLGLGKLIMLYDSNDITIEGNTNVAFTENIQERFESMGWEYFYVEDGKDVDEIEHAVNEAKKNLEKPSVIEIKTKIGYGSKSVEGTAKAHGAPLGEQGIKELYEFIGVPDRKPFDVDTSVYEEIMPIRNQLALDESAWYENFKKYQKEEVELAKELDLWMNGLKELHIDIEKEAGATRAIAGKALNKVFDLMPSLVGGSGDLAPSNGTEIKSAGYIAKGHYNEPNIHYGIREHAMAGIANGIAAHGGLRTFTSTFLAFSNYMAAGIRMAALMKLPNVFIFTHDSIAAGEDGPTHQPIDQIPSLRAIPNLNVIRPADANEVVAAYEQAFTSVERPTVVVLSRQKLPYLEGITKSEEAKKGAYIVKGAQNPEVCIIATGSEVSLALDSAELLSTQGVSVRVVSMPCMEIFEEQSEEYKNSILPKDVPAVSIEAAATLGWHKYADLTIGIDVFGASAPGKDVLEHFGFVPEKVAEKIKNYLSE